MKLAIILLFATQLLHAGSETHGGGGLECDNGEVLFYDLYEATIPGELSSRGLNIVSSTDPVETQVERAFAELAKMDAALTSLVRKAYSKILKRVHPVPQGSKLLPPTDVSGELMKEGCELRGVASYNDERERLLVDEKLTARMNATHLSAMWVHESVYKVLRQTQGAEDSRSTRKLVAHLFSERGVENLPGGFLKSNLKRDSRPNQTLWRVLTSRKISTDAYFDWKITHASNQSNPDCLEAELVMFPMDENGNWIEERIITTPLDETLHPWHFRDVNRFEFSVSRSSDHDKSECQYTISLYNSVMGKVTTFPIFIPAERMHSLDYFLELKEGKI